MYKFIIDKFIPKKNNKDQIENINIGKKFRYLERLLNNALILMFSILFLKVIVNNDVFLNFINFLLIPFKFLKTIFKKETRIESLLTIAVTLSGFTITILSIFGIGVSKATEKLAGYKFIKNYLEAIKKSLISSVILTIYTLIIDEINIDFLIVLYLYVIAKTVINYIYLGIVTYRMFKINLNNIEEEKKERIRKENEEKQNMTDIILLLEKLIKKIDNK